MNCMMDLFILLFSLLITTKCDIQNHETIHYKSYHFEWNNRDEWSINNVIQSDSEIISCTINIPSLCIYAIPTKPGFQLFYKHLMFDFLNDQNWTQIIVTNNLDIDHGHIDDTHIHIDIDVDIDNTNDEETNNEETYDEQQDDKKQDLETAQRRRLRSSRRIPIYRYWKGSGADHFYTQSRTEIGTTQKGRRGRHGYKSEGIAFYLAQRRSSGMVPLYRYWKSGIIDHFYTTNRNEIGTTRRGRRGRHGYVYEGILGYCYRRRRSGTVPLYRYWKGGRRGDHFYTTNRNEIGTTQKGRKGRYGYRSEGVTCYVYNRPYHRNRRHRRRHRRRRRRPSRHRYRRSRGRLRASLKRARARARRRAREARQRRRVYKSLYRFGKMLGRSMKTGNFRGLCGLAGTCGGGCGHSMRARCPTRFATYLGPPHIVGPPSYILGAPPVGHAPSGYGRSQSFGMGLGVSPIYPGMMGGYHGVMGGLWPGTYHGVNGNPQNMAQHGLMVGGPHIVGAAAVAGNRRRMIEGEGNGYYDDRNDIILRKCRLIKEDERRIIICATYYYYDGSVSLDYNFVVDGNEYNDEGKIGMFGDDEERDNKLPQYIKSSIWIWKEDERNLIQCDDNLLSFIGYTVCVEQRDDDGDDDEDEDEDEIFVLIMEHMDDPPIDELSLMEGEEWDKIYEFNDIENHKKICQYISMIEICFESKSNHKNIQITTQRILPDDP